MAEVTKTRLQLIYQIAYNLGVLAAGQTPSDEDISAIDGIIDPMLQMLSSEGVVTVADQGEPVGIGGIIEGDFFLPIASIGANEAKQAFGMAGDSSLFVLAQQAEERLRRLTRPPQTRRTLTTDPVLNRSAWPWSRLINNA